MTDYNACMMEIYKNGSGSHHCKVTLGVSKFLGGSTTHEFQPGVGLYDFPLNGPGKGKAIKKVRQRLLIHLPFSLP